MPSWSASADADPVVRREGFGLPAGRRQGLDQLEVQRLVQFVPRGEVAQWIQRQFRLADLAGQHGEGPDSVGVLVRDGDVERVCRQASTSVSPRHSATASESFANAAFGSSTDAFAMSSRNVSRSRVPELASSLYPARLPAIAWTG